MRAQRGAGRVLPVWCEHDRANVAGAGQLLDASAGVVDRQQDKLEPRRADDRAVQRHARLLHRDLPAPGGGERAGDEPEALREAARDQQVGGHDAKPSRPAQVPGELGA